MTKDYRLDADSAKFKVTASPVEFWLHDSFSEFWYKDAVREAQSSDDHAKRREIVFSTCFLESYIFEWTRDLVRDRGFGIDHVNVYFPPELSDPRSHRSLKDKWKCVPTELFENGVMSVKPDLDLSELGRLVSYRNGLIHARASRPSTASLSNNKAKPVPAVGELRNRENGWAIGVAEKLVKKLHQDIGTPRPEYIR